MSRRKQLIWLVLVLIGALLMFSACGGGDSSPESEDKGSENTGKQEENQTGGSMEPLKVGYVGPLAGDQAETGLAYERGVKLAIEEINAAGGVLGRQLELNSRDSNAEPEKGRSAVLELVSRVGIDWMIGPIWSTVALSGVPILEENKILTGLPGSTIPEWNDGVKHPYVYRNIFTTDMLAQALVAYGYDHKGAKKFGILTWAEAFGQESTASAQKILDKMGLESQVEKFNMGETDLIPQARKLKAYDADVVLLFAVGPDVAKAIQSVRSLGWDVPILAHQGATAKSVFDLLPQKDLTNVFAADLRLSARDAKTDALDPKTREMEEKISARFGPVVSSIMPTALSYDMLKMFAAAATKAGSVEVDAVKKVLESAEFSYQGVVANYKVTPENHHMLPLDALTIVQIGKWRDGTNPRAPEVD